MIFEVIPSQIETLDSKQLVELLKKLLHAEAQHTGISLSGVSIPLQINVPDGGEDARVSWIGGLEKTNYLPSRFSIFQSKATKLGPTGWKKEVWTKSSQKKGAIRKLNDAVTKVISKQGSYVGFTSAVVIGGNYDRRIESIKQGIREAGGDPEQIKIDIYDANKIAEWASQHPAVAVWLNERQAGFSFKGFQTAENWGKKADISSITHVDDKGQRFEVVVKNSDSLPERETKQNNTITFQKIKERITDHLAGFKKFVRIIGPSGVGKTRFVYEIFKDVTTLSKISLSSSAIYCDYRDIDHQIFQTTQRFSESGNSVLIIVDECPREIADKLADIAIAEGSKLRILTVGNDDRPIEKNKGDGLNVAVLPADDALIEGIIKQRFPKADPSDISFIKNLSGGYPRIAVLATDNYLENTPILKSIEDVVDKILTGCGITGSDQIRAIECLSLFKRLGADEELSYQIDFVAKGLARQTGDEMFEHLAQASRHHIVERRGRFFTAQPLPIAAFLGARRLDLLRVKSIFHFIEEASPDLLILFLEQWRHFDTSSTAKAVSKRLVAIDGPLGSLDALNSELGSECLNALVHVNPDTVADTINRVFGKLSVDQLKEVKVGRRNLVWALEKLVFRKSSFSIAARLLLRLAAVENEDWANNATGQFKQLFQLKLSGTEAEPSDRFAVLDEGLLSDDERIFAVCIEALEATLDRGHFSRSGGSELIGSQPPLKDWRPMFWEEVFDFHRSGLQRLDKIRSEHPQVAKRCESIIASSVRVLICENLFDDIKGIAIRIAGEKGIWLEALESVGDWLYFDRKGVSVEFSKKVREFYDSLMPTDLVQKALLYTKFWSADIRDPDLNYDPNDSSSGKFEYSSKKAREVAAEIAADKTLTKKAIQMMAAEELHNAFPFAHEMAMKVEDPLNTFKLAVKEMENSDGPQNGIQFIRGMLTGIDEKDEKTAEECIQIALNSSAFKDQTINIYAAVKISPTRLSKIVRGLKDGTLAAAGCVILSYGKGLDNLRAEDIFPFIDELASNHGTEGVLAAIEIIYMYQYGRSELDKRVAEWLKKQFISPNLLMKVGNAARNGYQLEQLILLIKKHFGIDDEFATKLSEQVTRLCQVDNQKMFFALDDLIRKIIKLLVKEKPEQLWKVLSRFFEMATPLEAHRLESLIEPSSHGSDDGYHNREGVLFGIPESECINWAKIDPAVRAPFLCHFYPLFEESETDSTWQPSLERLAIEFGSIREFRQALARRFHPRTWWGSMVPHLEVYLKPLKSWFGHPKPEMSRWAREMHRSLEKQIFKERDREMEKGRT